MKISLLIHENLAEKRLSWKCDTAVMILSAPGTSGDEVVLFFSSFHSDDHAAALNRAYYGSFQEEEQQPCVASKK